MVKALYEFEKQGYQPIKRFVSLPILQCGGSTFAPVFSTCILAELSIFLVCCLGMLSSLVVSKSGDYVWSSLIRYGEVWPILDKVMAHDKSTRNYSIWEVDDFHIGQLLIWQQWEWNWFVCWNYRNRTKQPILEQLWSVITLSNIVRF